jgi:hypothetical protein
MKPWSGFFIDRFGTNRSYYWCMVRRKVITRSYTHVGWRDATGDIKIQQIWDFIWVARPVCRSTRCQKGVLLILNQFRQLSAFGCGQTRSPEWVFTIVITPCDELISQCSEEFEEAFFLDIMSSPCKDKRGATWNKSSGSGLENWD